MTPLAGRKEWSGLAILSLPVLLLSIDLSVLYLAIPDLTRDLGPTSQEQLWILDVYGFLVAGLLITMGTLGDRIGRRRLLFIGTAMFGAASLVAATATSPEVLIAARAALGVAGATLAPSTLALVTTMFQNPKQRGMAIAIWSSCFGGGAVLGPTIGGALLSVFWWGSVFLLAVPVTVLLLVAGPFLLPEYRNANAGRLDLPSAGLSIAAVIPFVYGVKTLTLGGGVAAALLALVVGALSGILFVHRQTRLRDPLLDLTLFATRSFSYMLTLSLLVGAVQGGSLLLINEHLQVVVGLSTLATGLCLVPAGAAMIVTMTLSPAFARRLRPGNVIALGLLVSAAGYGLLTRIPAAGASAPAVLATCLIMAGVGPVVALGYDLMLRSVPAEKAGSAAATAETAGQFGVAAGIAALGSIGAALYRSQVDLPDNLPARAAAAADSVTAAAAVSANLPAPIGRELLEAARQASTSSFQLVAALAGLLIAALAVLAAWSLRHVPSSAAAGDGGVQAGFASASLNEQPEGVGRGRDEE
ncbi:MFS transporter [Asanoa sp. NPDC049573]|uniref:MFS transporter n=1 Tax=Asanoa sp. NPDC049573 TaxID=3155396 RepID=UPI0034214392